MPAGTSKAETSKAEAEVPSTNGVPKAPPATAAAPKARVLGAKGWESDPIYSDLVPVPGQPGTHANDPVSEAVKLFLDVKFKHPMRGVSLDPAAFHQ